MGAENMELKEVDDSEIIQDQDTEAPAAESAETESGEETTDQDSGPDDMLGELLSQVEDEPSESDDGETDDEQEPPVTEETPPPSEDVQDSKGLQAQLDLLREQNKALLQLVAQQKAPTPAPAKPVADPLPANVIRMVVQGATKDEWDRIPPALREKAQQFATDYHEREARYAADPTLRYQEVYRDKVMEDVFSVVQPIIKDYHERRAAAAVEKHLNPLDPKLQVRAKEIYAQLPGARSASWEDQEAALKSAAGLAKLERLEEMEKNKQQGKTAQNVQRNVTGGKSLKPAPKAQGSAAKKPIPAIRPDEKLTDYYERIKPFVK